MEGVLPEGVNVPQVTAHIDVLPTLCELAGSMPEAVDAKIEGRSLVPLLMNQNAEWPDRPLVTHQGGGNVVRLLRMPIKTAVFEKADGVW